MILLLPYGNSLRRDDGAGFILGDVVERMLFEADIEVERIDSHQLEPELALNISGGKISAILFIDARALPDEPGGGDLLVHFHRIFPAENASSGTSHHMDPSALLALVGCLFGKQPPAWLITVPGTDFDHGEGLSDTARKALDSAPGILHELIGLLPAF